MIVGAPPATPYDRLARTARHRWWRPLAGTLLVLAATVFTGCVIFGVAAVVAELTGRPTDDDGIPVLGPVADTALLLLVVAAALPSTLAAARWVQRRPAGTVSSVTGRLRLRWLGVCLLAAVPLIGVLLFGAELLLRLTGHDESLTEPAAWVGWPAFGVALSMIVLLVPFQAAAEEYVFRGWLPQAVGAYLANPWPGIVLSALLFSALHGYGTPWGFAELTVMGLLMGWLTRRTGGLEAAVALHVVNNVLAFALTAAYGGLGATETMADAPWQVVAVSVPVLVTYTVLVDRLAGRRAVATVTAAPPVPVAPGPYLATGPR
ncbi:lysostaphin resistance A-like protein [Micromonospora sp. SH-82]|uniref:CPBP family intramembrane glutamic endopeptidase n=1 Tax=Micromonospora sp. SH-82 TaxID=3132938 RepID=UPI003EBD83A3